MKGVWNPIKINMKLIKVWNLFFFSCYYLSVDMPFTSLYVFNLFAFCVDFSPSSLLSIGVCLFYFTILSLLLKQLLLVLLHFHSFTNKLPWLPPDWTSPSPSPASIRSRHFLPLVHTYQSQSIFDLSPRQE